MRHDPSPAPLALPRHRHRPARPALAILLAVLCLTPAAARAGGGKPGQPAEPPRAELPVRLAIQGLDPVRLLDDGREVAGQDDLAVVDGAWRYLFESARTRKTFLKHPERYRLASGDQCAVMPGLRAHPGQWLVHDGKLYGFATPSARQTFIAESEKYLDEAGNLKRWHDALTVAVPLYPGFEWADVGVSEIFGVPGREGFFRVRLLAADHRLVPARTAGAVQADATFDELPEPDIILVPGGDLDGALADPGLMDWLRRAAPGAQRILAVNNAPWLLAEAGLLDGHRAVINPALHSLFQAVAPGVEAVPNTRWVESDGILTASGAESGMEAAIKVVGDIRGRFRGQMTARYFGIVWQPEMEPVPKDYSHLEEGQEAAGDDAAAGQDAAQDPAAAGGAPRREPPQAPAPRP